jgi:hypothetical protein
VRLAGLIAVAAIVSLAPSLLVATGSQAGAPGLDITRPNPPRPLEPAGWVAGDVRGRISIEPPPTPLPPSGIRGYAVSVDRHADGFPCASPDHCAPAEVDAPFAPSAVTVDLGFLPEGVHLAHVVAVSGAGVPSAVRTVEVRVDASAPEVSLLGLPPGWARGPVRLVASARDRLSGMRAAGPNGPFTAVAVDSQPPATAPGTEVATTVVGEGTHVVAFYGRDAAGNIGDGQAGRAPAASAVVRIDTTPPRIAFTPSQDPTDPERIEATVADSLSGPSRGRGSIAFRPANTKRQFTPIPTALSGGRLVGRWDSEAVPPGSYEFRVTGYDAAGNAATSGHRPNRTRLVLVNPVKRLTSLQVGFGGRQSTWRPAARSLPYGRGVLLGGRLAAGAPLPGRRIELVESFGAGAELPIRTSVATTGEDGVFLARLSPGPSRTIEARFAGDRVLCSAGGRPLRLSVPGAVRFRASAARAVVGGAPVRFSGRVGAIGAIVPAAGLQVELQFRLSGSDWREFRTVQTDRRGRFRYLYAFSDDDSRGARFQFRALVPAQPEWPYEAGASDPVIVTGR